jgi:hypothetical protein
MIAFGVLALIPGLSTSPTDAGLPSLLVENSYGAFLNLVPMNIINKFAVVALGIWGVIAANAKPTVNYQQSVIWARATCVVLAALTILGIIPMTNTLYGYWPLFGANVAVYGVFAVLSAYYGFVLPKRERSHSRYTFDRAA